MDFPEPPAPPPEAPPAEPFAPPGSPAPSPESAAPPPVASDFRVSTAAPAAQVGPTKTSLLPWALLGAAGVAAAALVMFAGEAESNPHAFRLTARLSRPLAIRNVPGMWWRAVHRLAIDPSEPTPWNVEPLLLKSGSTYDMRLLSRDKTAAHRAEVSAILGRIGFDPVDSLLARRNVRAPGRPGVSLSEWIAVGTWRGPNTLTTPEDEVLFTQLREVQ